MVDRVGQQLGNYRLVRLLGRGGFAEVYLGEHLRLNTQVAIKVLHTSLEDDDVEDFLREAQTVAHLKHPHIVRVFDFDVENHTPFLVMDYLPNGNIRRSHPKGTPLPLPTIISYVTQAASALQYAHDEKLIHRDVKPENMLLDKSDTLVLSDFGIALMAQSSRYQSTQEVAGTAAYMAPEQFQGKPRRASDQYALGVVVYEWLSGDRPFHGSFSEIASQHLFVPPPLLREKGSTISPDVEQIVLTALEKDPHKRFASVRAFATALEQANQAPRLTFVPPQPVSPPAPSPLPPPVPSLAPQQLVGPLALPPMHYAGGTPLQEMRSPSNASYSTAAGPTTGQSSGKIEQASIWRIGRQQIAAIIARVRPTTKPPVVYAVKPWSIDKRQVVAMLMSLAFSVCLSILGALFALFVRSNPPPAVIIYIVGIVLLSLELVTPEFFGAVFGPWVGLFTGGASLLAGAIIFANILALLISRTLIPIDQIASAYSQLWFVHLSLTLVGFMSGFAMFKKKGRYNIGRTLGFSSLGAVAGSAFLIIVLFIQFHTDPHYFVNATLIPVTIIALGYVIVGLILLPTLLVVYNRIVVSSLQKREGTALAPRPRSDTAVITSRRNFSTSGKIALGGLAILFVVGSIAFIRISIANTTASDNAQATASAEASATASAAWATVVAANPDPYPSYNGKLALYDPLSQPDHWYSYSDASWGGACQFTNGTYHISQSKPNRINICSAYLDFSNFAFEVQMKIIKGDCGGIGFRNDGSNGKDYLFEVCPNGNYNLYRYTGNSNSTILASNSTSAISPGQNQSNTIAVVANGSTFDLYVNNQKVNTVSDSTYSHGQLGLFANSINNPTEVVYSNAKVWTM